LAFRSQPSFLNFPIFTRAWTRRVALLPVCVLLLLLAGCKFDLQPVEKPSTPTVTVSPSVSNVLPEEIMDSPSPVPEEPEPIATPEAIALLPATPAGTITPTITPWPNDTPTAGPSPTPSRTPTRTRAPTRTRVPTQTATITETPTITFTPTPPPPDQQLLRPGLFSKVISPIKMEMYAVTGDNGLVIVELIGEDGRIISRQLLDYGRSKRFVYAVPEVPFEIAAVSEIARLQVRSEDAFGRIIALSSVDLILLSVGRNELNPAEVSLEPYIIRSPRAGAVVREGMLIVEGVARPVNDSFMVLELITESGRIISTKQFKVDPPSGGQTHTPFRLEIPYQVEESTPVRMSIRQDSSRIPGSVAITSRTITIDP
jgi:hypothetical protein